jgi:hypothetical protein
MSVLLFTTARSRAVCGFILLAVVLFEVLIRFLAFQKSEGSYFVSNFVNTLHVKISLFQAMEAHRVARG